MAAISASPAVACRLAAPADGLSIAARASLATASRTFSSACSLSCSGRRPRSCASNFMSLKKLGSQDGRSLSSSFPPARHRRSSARRESQKAPERENQLQDTKTTELETVNEAEAEVEAGPPQSTTLEIVFAAITAILLGVTNRVLYKMALVPLTKYPFFLAQLTTLGYVVTFFTTLLFRYRSGIVTKEMLSIPKGQFAAMGALEALGLASGMAAATALPGTMITVLSQSFLAWQLALSSILLGKRFSLQQVLGVTLVIAGVVTATLFSSGAGPSSLSFKSSGLLWPAVMVLSAMFPAWSSIIKEGVFKKAAKTLPGGQLDIFVVNSFGSGFQALFVFLLLPVLARVGLQIPFSELPAYFQDGAACMLNMGTAPANCQGAPLLPLLYIAANLAFNISVVSLLKKSSAVVTSLSMSAAVPLTIAAFTLPLPLLGSPQSIGWGFVGGASLLVSGLFVYNSSSIFTQFLQKEKGN